MFLNDKNSDVIVKNSNTGDVIINYNNDVITQQSIPLVEQVKETKRQLEFIETRRQSRRKIKPYLAYDNEEENDGNDSGQSSDYDSDYTSDEESDYYTTTETEQSDNNESEREESDGNNGEPYIVDHATGEINRGTLEIWKLNTDSPVGKRIRKIKRYGGRARILYDATFMRTLEMEEARKYTGGDESQTVLVDNSLEINDNENRNMDNLEDQTSMKMIESEIINTNHGKEEEEENKEVELVVEDADYHTTNNQSVENTDNSNSDVNTHVSSDDFIVDVTSSRSSAEENSNNDVFVSTSESVDKSYKKQAGENTTENKVETNNIANNIYTKFDIDKKQHIEFEEVFDTIVETHVETIEELGPVETVYTNQIIIDSVRGDVYDEDCTTPHVHTPDSSYNYPYTTGVTPRSGSTSSYNYPYTATVTTPRSSSTSSINYPYFTKTTTPKSGSTTPRTPSTSGQYQRYQTQNPFFPDSPSFQYGYSSPPPYTSSPIKNGQTPEKSGQDPRVLIDYEGDYVVIDLENNNIKCRDRHSTSVFMYVQ